MLFSCNQNHLSEIVGLRWQPHFTGPIQSFWLLTSTPLHPQTLRPTAQLAQQESYPILQAPNMTAQLWLSLSFSLLASLGSQNGFRLWPQATALQ